MPAPMSPSAEHRYRIIGKIRLAMFWLERDNVGGARMTWRSDRDASVISLLAGSDPQRAPRSINRWVYLREETRASHARVFGLRSLGVDQAPPDHPIDGGDGPLFGVSCAAMTRDQVNSATTTVIARGVTYWMFDRLLDQIDGAGHWREREMSRPVGSAAGFLSALQRVIVDDAAHGSFEAVPAATYVYDNTVYDLSVRRRQTLQCISVGPRFYERLLRVELAVRNRTTGEVTTFAMTHAPIADGVPLPVQIFYQPSFWVRIELRLDEHADVPAEPATDQSQLARIRTICDQADSHRD